MKRLRCAIYTRKSSEEGLEQSFNSLDAQRESCEAYVASQKSEGWIALPTLYDDGGFSGGNMARPALVRLLADIAAGQVDVVVVYKVDRLTRALADFAKIVEVFDSQGVSFVSVTQAFNTTSSMGRLTLNVLLSFAQFEREVTGERIRDKIAASKAKGMWMGGNPPLGYTMVDRKLLIVPDEAETVRMIFTRYLALKSVNALSAELNASGVQSKLHLARNGNSRGGTSLSRGALFHLLKNRIYVGEIVHKKQVYPGLHDGIVDPRLFERVQQQLANNAVKRTTKQVRSAPLCGLIFDANGGRMTPAHSYGQSGVRYRYYVSASESPSQGANSDLVSRVSANLVEEVVIDRLRRLADAPGASWTELLPTIERVAVQTGAVILTTSKPVRGYRSRLYPDDEVEVSEEAVRITIPACMQPRKGTTSLALPAARTGRRQIDRPLVAALKRAHLELEKQELRFAGTRVEVSEARGLDDPYLRRIAPLAFLAPDIQRSILEGRQPPGLTLKSLTRVGLPTAWSEQRRRFGFV